MSIRAFKFVIMAFLGMVCAFRLNADGPAPAIRRVEDLTGRKVLIPARPRHVLSLCTSVTDTMMRLGAEDRLAGIDEYSRIVPGTAKLAVLGKGSAISREQVLSREIDLVFVWWFQEDVAEMLADLRVPTVRIRCGRAEEIPASIRLVGLCAGLTNAANELAARVSTELNGLRQSAATNGPRVFIEMYSPFKTSGRDSYLNDLIELAGGHNVAAGATGSILFSAERLLESDPDVVVVIDGFGTPEEFARRSGLENLSAVKLRRIHVIDRYCLVAGAGLPEDVAKLRQLFNRNFQSKG